MQSLDLLFLFAAKGTRVLLGERVLQVANKAISMRRMSKALELALLSQDVFVTNGTLLETSDL